MATLHFDGNSRISGSGQGALNGALSFACLFCRDDTTKHTLFQSYSGASDGSTVVATLQTLFTNNFEWYSGGVSATSGAWLSTTLTDWMLFAFTRAAGSSVPRLHAQNITAAGAWVHANGSAAMANPASVAAGGVQLGAYGDMSSNDDLIGNIALVGWWNGTVLSDGQIEMLGTEVSSWHALAPSSLTAFDTLTPVDLEGLMTWTVTGATLTAPEPPAPLEPPPETHPPTGGEYGNTTGGIIETVVRGGTPVEPLRGGTPLVSIRAGTYDETATGGEVL